jgi:replicative DNA helicase
VTTPDGSALPGLGDASEFAAAALLGALLWRPERVAEVSGWLAPEDFARPAYGVIYSAVLTHHEHRSNSRAVPDGDDDEPAVALTSIARELMTTPHAELHSHAGDPSNPLSAPALHTLLSLTPAGPDGRSEHVRYARLVLEASIRRQISAAGARIAQFAAMIPTRRSDDAAAVLQQATGQTAAQLNELHQHLIAAAGPSSPIAAALDPIRDSTRAERPLSVVGVNGVVDAGSDTTLAAGTTAVPLSPPTHAEIERAELGVLGACVANQSVRAAALESLRSEDFTREKTATTWLALRSLVERGDPVDVVLLAAETELIGATPGYEEGMTGPELLCAAQRYGDPANGYRVIDTVARASLIRHATATAAALRTIAVDRALGGPEVVQAARTRVAALAAAAHRLDAGTDSPISPATLAATTLAATAPLPAPAARRPGAAAPSGAPPPRQRTASTSASPSESRPLSVVRDPGRTQHRSRH